MKTAYSSALARYVLSAALLFILVVSPFRIFGQAPKSAEIKGSLTDAETKEALVYATVAVYTAQDTTMVTFRMSDAKGQFRVPGLPLDQQLRVVITMVGFNVYRKEFSLTTAQPALDFGQIVMEQSSSMLGEVVVLAEIPPILVKNDTLEFNASSFKTLPSALVEDLLKKLPGVTVDAAGNIRVNGKAVHKILVDGKEFFGSDPTIASRNLPADVIEKVQVMNDPEVLRRDPDLPAGDIPQVINLTFKKGIKKGMFGKVYGGVGTDNRYEGGGILNAFRDTTQISIIGYTNNLNKAGFGMGDMRKIGGFDRSGMSSIMVHSDGGYAINGISFGGMGEGVQQSSGGGANFNTVTKKGVKLNLQYFYGGIKDNLDQIINSRQFLENDTLNSRQVTDKRGRNYNHQIGGKLDWKLDSLTDLTISPTIAYRQGLSDLNRFITTYRDAGEPVNTSQNDENTEDGNLNFSGTYALNRIFAKKGRIFNLNGTYEYAVFSQDKYNIAQNQFFEPQPTTSELNQFRNNDRTRVSIQNAASYTEPIIKDLSAVFRLNSEYFSDDNTISTFLRDPESGDYLVPVEDFSSRYDRRGWRTHVTTGLKWKVGKATIQPSVRFTALDINSDFRDGKPIAQNYFYVFPSLNVRWKELSASYSVDLKEPDAVDLQPIVDNTNPLFIRYGNPNLRPTVSHTVNLNLYKFNMQKAFNYSFFAYGSISNDAVTRQRTVEANGVQVVRPVNTDGNRSLNGGTNISKDFKYKSGRQISVGAGMFGGFNRSLLMLNDVETYSLRWNLSPSVNAGFNLNDKFEFDQSLRFNIQGSRYEQQVFADQDFVTRTSETGIVLRMPKKIVWEANYENWYSSNTVPGLQNSIGRLNAAVTFLFMKNDRAQLKLSVYDLLDQNVNAYRSIKENMIEDFQSMTLTRYGMLTFTYNIRNFGGKVGSTSNNSLFRF
ncbi:TonB-dependent receptor [Pontibacter sp. Tf4]|uniref:outer membrane beta-barrel protein n=1 Tax=Pontibacter sp. Tf4 TaxID=2761620 RepID=UPI00162324ED|nr:outer membrane beta-barrel protein [Pontibacter sp. Tf4]MBB6612959.1 TonB-dependent receptor [Pontibacter sp. Tf4]